MLLSGLGCSSTSAGAHLSWNGNTGPYCTTTAIRPQQASQFNWMPLQGPVFSPLILIGRYLNKLKYLTGTLCCTVQVRGGYHQLPVAPCRLPRVWPPRDPFRATRLYECWRGVQPYRLTCAIDLHDEDGPMTQDKANSRCSYRARELLRNTCSDLAIEVSIDSSMAWLGRERCQCHWGEGCDQASLRGLAMRRQKDLGFQLHIGFEVQNHGLSVNRWPRVTKTVNLNYSMSGHHPSQSVVDHFAVDEPAESPQEPPQALPLFTDLTARQWELDSLDPPRPKRHASIFYMKPHPRYNVEKPYFFNIPVGASWMPNVKQTNVMYTRKQVAVTDIRGHEPNFRLDDHGFQLGTLATSIPYANFASTDVIVTKYYEEVKQFLMEQLRATQVLPFDFQVSSCKSRHVLWPCPSLIHGCLTTGSPKGPQPTSWLKRCGHNPSLQSTEVGKSDSAVDYTPRAPN